MPAPTRKNGRNENAVLNCALENVPMKSGSMLASYFFTFKLEQINPRAGKNILTYLTVLKSGLSGVAVT